MLKDALLILSSPLWEFREVIFYPREQKEQSWVQTLLLDFNMFKGLELISDSEGNCEPLRKVQQYLYVQPLSPQSLPWPPAPFPCFSVSRIVLLPRRGVLRWFPIVSPATAVDVDSWRWQRWCVVTWQIASEVRKREEAAASAVRNGRFWERKPWCESSFIHPSASCMILSKCEPQSSHLKQEFVIPVFPSSLVIVEIRWLDHEVIALWIVKFDRVLVIFIREDWQGGVPQGESCCSGRGLQDGGGGR